MSNKPATPAGANARGASAAPPPADRRDTQRRRTLLSGVVSYANGEHSFSCIIRNLTENGARISVPDNLSLPPRIYLIHLRSRIAFECDVAWRRGADAGLHFVRTHPLGELSDPNLAYLKRLALASDGH